MDAKFEMKSESELEMLVAQVQFPGQVAVAAGQAQMETDARGQSGLSETDCQAHF